MIFEYGNLTGRSLDKTPDQDEHRVDRSATASKTLELTDKVEYALDPCCP